MGKYYKGIPPELALELREQYKLLCFIETGTYNGRTTTWAAKHFDAVLTIELDPAIYKKMTPWLSLLANVQRFQGNSAEMLPRILNQVFVPALIWLDAHWSRDLGYGRPEFGECPVLAEIEAITCHGLNHVVLIDDARYFVNPPPKPHKADQWPTFDEIKETFGLGWSVQHKPKFDILLAVREERGEDV